jgi:hypothetical protein
MKQMKEISSKIVFVEHFPANGNLEAAVKTFSQSFLNESQMPVMHLS